MEHRYFTVLYGDKFGKSGVEFKIKNYFLTYDVQIGRNVENFEFQIKNEKYHLLIL